MIITPGLQMRVSDYADYRNAGGDWQCNPKGKYGIRIVGEPTIYWDFWVMGDYLKLAESPLHPSFSVGGNTEIIWEYA
jgi:hypothetical protein